MKKKQIMDDIEKLSQLVYSRRGPAKIGVWRGYRCLKYGTDLMLYAEMIHTLKPDFIIETGTRFGGSALFLADMCELEGRGEVITVDIEPEYEGVTPPDHPRLTKIIGNSVAQEVLAEIKERVAGKHVLVILDSDHQKEHLRAELEAYAPLLKVGDYLIAEDIYMEEGYLATRRFLKENSQKFRRDKDIEKYGIHCGRDGFFVRID